MTQAEDTKLPGDIRLELETGRHLDALRSAPERLRDTLICSEPGKNAA